MFPHSSKNLDPAEARQGVLILMSLADGILRTALSNSPLSQGHISHAPGNCTGMMAPQEVQTHNLIMQSPTATLI